MINGSPTKIEDQSENNVRFKRLEPQVALSGLHNTPPQKKDFNVKKAVNYTKQKPQPVQFPFSNGNTEIIDAPYTHKNVPSNKKNIFTRSLNNIEQADSGYRSYKLPLIEKTNFEKKNHQNYQCDFRIED